MLQDGESKAQGKMSYEARRCPMRRTAWLVTAACVFFGLGRVAWANDHGVLLGAQRDALRRRLLELLVGLEVAS